MAICLCHTDDIPESGARGFDLPQASILAVKKSGRIFTYFNSCPHQQLPLEWKRHEFLDNEGNFLKCSNHGALFNIHDGLCIQGPCKGDTLESLPYTLENGSIMIAVTDLP